jgi:Mrp family chromosome partitioning ATPase/capsular polysaccharide biosynthesis protein
MLIAALAKCVVKSADTAQCACQASRISPILRRATGSKPRIAPADLGKWTRTLSTKETPAASTPSTADDDQIDVHRYLAALSRSRWLIAAIVGGVTLVVVVVSLVLPKTYDATAKLVFTPTTDVISPPDALTQQRDLATIESLLEGTTVISRAASELATSQNSLKDELRSSADSSANIISLTASSRDPDRAAEIANTVAHVFLVVHTSTEQQQLRAARQNLLEQVRRLQARRTPAAATQLGALRQAVNDLSVQQELAGSDLELASKAEVPTGPSSPKPVRNAVIAFFASLFVAVLIALGRDQLRPKINSPRELSRLTRLPVLTAIPYVRGPLLGSPFGRRVQALTAAEHEAYQALQTSLRFTLPPGRQNVILVTSAVHGEGKTTVTARLGRALAHAGYNTLLISADLRVPRLHQAFRLSSSPGFANLLEYTARRGKTSPFALPATVHSIHGGGRTDGPGATDLDVLASGESDVDPAQLLSSAPIGAFFEQVRASDYDYVLVDSPPLLGMADAQTMIHEVDAALVVARLDRLTTENVIDTEELLSRLDAPVLGLVVIGARSEFSPYYVAQRRELTTGASA